MKPESCRACPLYGAPGPVWSTPAAPGAILFVGEAPGNVEVVQGKGFVGPSGRLLWRLARSVGIDPVTAGRANVIKCLPPAGEEPPERAVLSCRHFLDAELAAHRGVVVAVGGTALRALLGHEGIQRHRGRVYARGDSQHVIPVLHPAFLLHQGQWSWTPVMQRDLAKAASLAAGEAPAAQAQDYVYDAGAVVPRSVPLALDIETAGGRITRWSASWGPGKAVSVPWPSTVLAEAARSAPLLIFQNAIFDVPRLRAAGLDLAATPIYDTMVATAILDPDLPNDLEFSSSLYTELVPWKHLSEAQPELYNATDSDAAFRIYEATRAELVATGMMGTFQVSMQVLPVLMEMTRAGLRVNAKAMHAEANRLMQQEWRIDKWMHGQIAAAPRRQARIEAYIRQAEFVEAAVALPETPGKERVRMRGVARRARKAAAALATPNIGSTQQVASWLYDDLGLHGGKGRSTEESVLRELYRQTGMPQLRVLIKRRERRKLRGTYYSQALGLDGRIHPEFVLGRNSEEETGARTGRLASRNPNVQNWPRSTRHIVLPDDDGDVVVELDYRQIELQLIAWFAGGGMYERVTAPGFNAYVAFGQLAFGRGIVKGTREYLLSKRSVLSGCYKVGWKKFLQKLTEDEIYITAAESKRLLGLLPQMFPQLLWYWRSTEALGVSQGFISTPFGRQRKFYGPEPDVPMMMNFRPQGTTADLILRAMAALGPGGPGWRLMIQVHDSLVLSVRPDALRRVIPEVRQVMERQYDEMPGFSPVVEVYVGGNWGSLAPWKED